MVNANYKSIESPNFNIVDGFVQCVSCRFDKNSQKPHQSYRQYYEQITSISYHFPVKFLQLMIFCYSNNGMFNNTFLSHLQTNVPILLV